MKRSACGVLASVLVMLMGSSVQAAELTCSGRITQVNLHASDTFMLRLDSMNYPVFFCRPNAAWSVSGTTYTTSAETCRMLIGLFLAAKAQDKRLSVIYFDGDEVPASCDGWAPWRSANIRYFEWAD